MEKARFSLDKKSFKKIGIGLLVAIGGAIATYLEEQIPGLDFGIYSSLVVAINSMIVNLIRKFISRY